jgi:hypothetical protein
LNDFGCWGHICVAFRVDKLYFLRYRHGVAVPTTYDKYVNKVDNMCGDVIGVVSNADI